jgi:hypothetical protein
MINYLLITCNTIILLILIKLFANVIFRPKKPKSMADLIMRNPKMREMKELYEAMRRLNEDGTDQDIIPEGSGEFGYDITNPIPVNTIFGNTSYLGRLRTMDGIKVRYERRGSGHAKNIKNPIDIYDIYNGEEKIATLYISPYNKKNSKAVPRGFKLADMPWD